MLFRNLLYLLLFSHTLLFAQIPSVQWQKTFGGTLNETGLKVVQSFDETFYVAGTVQTALSGTDIYLAHLDKSGNQLWSVNLSGADQDTLLAISKCKDGGVAILCYSDSTVGTDFNQKGVYLVKYNNSGSEVFKTSHGGDPIGGGALIETSDNGYLFLSSKTGQKKDLWLRKTNSLGVFQWEKTFGGSEDEIAGDLLELNNNLYIIGESLSNSIKPGNTVRDRDLFWVKTDLSGNTPVTKFFGGSGSEFDPKMASSKAFSGDVQLMVSCSTNSNNLTAFPFYHGGIDVWAFSLDLSGNLNSTFNHYLGDQFDDFSAGVSFNSDPSDDPTIAFYSFNSFGTLNEPTVPNLVVSQLLPFGGESWSLIVGGSGNDKPLSFSYTYDGGYIVSGQTTSSSSGGFDHWLVKLAKPCVGEGPVILPSITYNESFSRTSESFITTSSKFEGIPSHVKLRSNYILMEPGFEVKSGVVFQTEIGGCP